MNYTVYALQSQTDGRIYVGFSSNVEKRLKEHNLGKTKSTKGFRPWIIIFSEDCSNRIEARIKEKYYKTGIGKEKVKKYGSIVQRIE
jgi:putative endonuclease